RIRRSPGAVVSTIRSEPSMSAVPCVNAMEPDWSTRIGNEMPRPMKSAAASLMKSLVYHDSVDQRRIALENERAGCLSIERPLRFDVDHAAFQLQRSGGLHGD